MMFMRRERQLGTIATLSLPLVSVMLPPGGGVRGVAGGMGILVLVSLLHIAFLRLIW